MGEKMSTQIETVTRSRPALVRFGGRKWELVDVEYETAHIKSRYAEAYVRADKVEALNEAAKEMLDG
jgi:hypothetical protein